MLLSNECLCAVKGKTNRSTCVYIVAVDAHCQETIAPKRRIIMRRRRQITYLERNRSDVPEGAYIV